MKRPDTILTFTGNLFRCLDVSCNSNYTRKKTTRVNLPHHTHKIITLIAQCLAIKQHKFRPAQWMLPAKLNSQFSIFIKSKAKFHCRCISLYISFSTQRLIYYGSVFKSIVISNDKDLELYQRLIDMTTLILKKNNRLFNNGLDHKYDVASIQCCQTI